MSEIIPDILAHDVPVIVLFESMVDCTLKSDICATFGIGPTNGKNSLSVEVKVNGVEVPFMASLGECITRWSNDFDKQVEAKALELIQERPALRHLLDTLNDCEWKIKEALEPFKDR